MLRVIGHGGCLWRMDMAAGWLCGLALDVAWPPQISRCGRPAVRLELIRRRHRVRAGLDFGPGVLSARSALLCANGGPPGSWCIADANRYAVPAGWVISCVVLVAAARGCADGRGLAS